MCSTARRANRRDPERKIKGEFDEPARRSQMRPSPHRAATNFSARRTVSGKFIADFMRAEENMFWIFKRQPGKLPGPRSIDDFVGRSLVVTLKKDPNWVWELKCVKRPRADIKQQFDFRVFSDSDVARARVKIRDFTSLDDHPELILFQGWLDKASMEVHFEEKTPAAVKAPAVEMVPAMKKAPAAGEPPAKEQIDAA